MLSIDFPPPPFFSLNIVLSQQAASEKPYWAAGQIKPYTIQYAISCRLWHFQTWFSFLLGALAKLFLVIVELIPCRGLFA